MSWYDRDSHFYLLVEDLFITFFILGKVVQVSCLMEVAIIIYEIIIIISHLMAAQVVSVVIDVVISRLEASSNESSLLTAAQAASPCHCCCRIHFNTQRFKGGVTLHK